MPQPKPLTRLASGVHANHLDEQVLTPRTPRSQFEMQNTAEGQYDDVDLRLTADYETQTIPLLSAEPNRTSVHHISGRTKTTSKPHRIIPVARFADIPLILGTLLALFLFGLIVFSYRNPGQLQEFVGTNEPRPSPVANEAAKNSPPPPTVPPPKETPLHPSEYVAQCRELNSGFMSHGDYWDKPLMDMKMDSSTDEKKEDTADEQYRLPEGGITSVCSKSITYLLDGKVGLLADLALIAQVASLARERNRTFFIDDTYWNRGKWTDHFQSHMEYGPEPGCRAPHPKDLVPCPRTASHWMITAHTAKYHFGHAFSEHYEDPYAHSLNRLRPIFNAARESFVSTIRPDAELGALIRSARHELKALVPSATPDSQDTYVSVHVRRGDKKHRFSTTPYTPVSEYTSYILSTQTRLSKYLDDYPVFFASDSLTAEREFAATYTGNYFSLRRSQDSALRRLASSQEYNQKEFNDLSSEERFILTRGMIVDFALLSGMWAWAGDSIPRAGICTISSNVCKMMAVGLGWDWAFGRVGEMGHLDENLKGWVEVEEKGKVVPIWTAFELF